MPDVAMPGAAAPPSGPGSAPGASPGESPGGASPATMPVANRGHAAAGLARLSQIVRLLEETVPLLGVGSEAGRDVLKSLQNLSKHVPPGAMSQGVEHN